MSQIIGIDLGTTNSAAAYMTDGGPRLVPNALGEVLTPSVIGIDADGKVLVGAAARELAVLQPERCASVFKRHMGSDWKTELAGRVFTPEELSSLVLRSIKEDAEAFFAAPVERAVITVPAYFNDRQRKATLRAGQLAGFEVARIFNEPTAAALAYGFHEAGQEKTLLIFDLGGGTFDVSVVELFEGVLEVKASSGESFLGGEDFTRTMAARLLESQGLPFEPTELAAPLMVPRLLQQCELAKRRLSQADAATLRLPSRAGDFTEDAPELSVTRSCFEEWTARLRARLEQPVRRVLADAGLKPADVHEVILVGGATRMPAVIAEATRLFDKAPHHRLNPDEVVALGAGVQAGLLGKVECVKDLIITDVAPFTLGVEVCKLFGGQLRPGYFLPVMHRNTTIPASRVERVATVQPNQEEVVVKVYQGESRRAEDNHLLGEFALAGIPRGPAGQAIDIRFTYDLNGVLEIEATVVATGKKVTHIITRHAATLTAEQIAEAVRAMEQLKRHPREEAENRFLLRRAERVYRELPRLRAQELSALLDGFEGALELGERPAIERHREALKAFLRQHDPEALEPETGNDDQP